MRQLSINFPCSKMLYFLAVAFFTACDSDDDVIPTPAPSITDLVVNGNNTTLLEAAVKKAGLATTLASTANLTVFAPDDDAFRALDLNGDGTREVDTEAKIQALDATGTALLTEVLEYHVYRQRVPAASVPAGPNAAIEMLSEENAYVTRNAAGVFINGTKVETADLEASNGVVHVIGRILIPSGGQNIVDLAQANPNLTYLVAAVLRANASGTNIAEALSAAGPLTVFAPTNDAFIAAGFPTIASIEAADPATLKNILLYHVVPGRVFSSDLTNGAQPATAGGGTVTITLNGGATVKGNGNTGASNIIATDFLAENGVIHTIDNVLLP